MKEKAREGVGSTSSEMLLESVVDTTSTYLSHWFTGLRKVRRVLCWKRGDIHGKDDGRLDRLQHRSELGALITRQTLPTPLAQPFKLGYD